MSRRSLYQWATESVMGITGRSRALVSRIVKPASFLGSSCTSLVAPKSSFEMLTEGLERWTEKAQNARDFNHQCFEGLDKPAWRETKDINTEKILESRPVTEEMFTSITLFCQPCDIQTTVWFGVVNKKKVKTPKLENNLAKGIQHATAVFLLEAIVLLTAGTDWSGAWTQRFYGSGSADVWEVFGEGLCLRHGLQTGLAYT